MKLLNEIEILKKMKNGIKICKEPFLEISKELGISEDELIERLEQMKEKEIIKSFGGTLNHINIGYKANGMVVWKVEPENVEKAGNIISKFEEVTHCYERKIIKNKWEYNIFAMIHCKTKIQLEELVKEISTKIQNYNYQIIYSSREFKKTGVQII